MTEYGAGPKKILIAEDDEEMREMYKMIFAKRPDYEIDIESGATEALHKTKEKSYDLVVIDIIMSPVSGDTLFVNLRNDKRTMRVPILVVSVLDQEALSNLKIMSNCDFLQKPLDPAKLLEKIRVMTSGNWGRE
ncbi:MAG: response regulator transcription factor [Candidatus Omnitrophica bacterium]|nr:response regulator transcription factor [Candidatus Omnitrophota bacterium]